MVFHSIRWRILAWNFGLLATTAGVLLVAFYQHERLNRLQAVDLHLREMMATHMGAVNDLTPGGNGGRTPPLNPNGRPRSQDNPQQRQAKAEAALASLAQEKTWVFIADMAGPVQFQTAIAPVEPALVDRCREEILEETEGPAKARQPVNLMVSHLGQRMLVHRPPGQLIVVFGTDTHALEADLRLLGWKLAFGGVILVVLGGGIGWVFLDCRGCRVALGAGQQNGPQVGTGMGAGIDMGNAGMGYVIGQQIGPGLRLALPAAHHPGGRSFPIGQ
jgi:hypothetical protein